MWVCCAIFSIFSTIHLSNLMQLCFRLQSQKTQLTKTQQNPWVVGAARICYFVCVIVWLSCFSMLFSKYPNELKWFSLKYLVFLLPLNSHALMLVRIWIEWRVLHQMLRYCEPDWAFLSQYDAHWGIYSFSLQKVLLNDEFFLDAFWMRNKNEEWKNKNTE